MLDYKQAESAAQTCISNAPRTFNVLFTCLYRPFLYPTLFSPLRLSNLLIKLLSKFFLPQMLSLFHVTTEMSSYIYFCIFCFTYIHLSVYLVHSLALILTPCSAGNYLCLSCIYLEAWWGIYTHLRAWGPMSLNPFVSMSWLLSCSMVWSQIRRSWADYLSHMWYDLIMCQLAALEHRFKPSSFNAIITTYTPNFLHYHHSFAF